ncbi:MAG: M20/M25/M40 family metallo-hydrolase [Chloroflexi bacterium]|nr:M20/M25/M40 family metallo-hydrolase [Chloroflexota bacterium]MBP8058985.1 M20/M25/M40 family metallo-hydrolase [Chloroflexota bacterium]
MKPQRFWPILLLILFSLSCTLLSSPERPQIPTPAPAAPTTAPVAISVQEALTSGQTVPVSAGGEISGVAEQPNQVVPAVDPDIMALVNEVSRQNLQVYVQTLEGFGTRHAFSDTQSETFGIGATRRWLYREFETIGRGRLQVQYQDFTLNPASSGGFAVPQQNIIATLPGNGTYPGVIVLMAHYDSRNLDPFDGQSQAPGATDNASGVAILLEAARLMSTRTWNQTVMFVAFAAEELQTQGSRHFITNSFGNGLQIDFALNSDIIGGHAGVSPSVRVFSPGPDLSVSRQFARYYHYINSLYFPNFQVILEDAEDRPQRYSDHREFFAVGIPALRLTEPDEDPNIQHTSRDTFERLDYDYMAQIVQANVVVLANLAGAPARPTPPTLASMADPGSYLLTWPTDRAAAGYVLSFRRPGITHYEAFYYVSALQAGNIALNGLDPQATYAFSMAPLDAFGRLGGFSPETILGPP